MMSHPIDTPRKFNHFIFVQRIQFQMFTQNIIQRRVLSLKNKNFESIMDFKEYFLEQENLQVN